MTTIVLNHGDHVRLPGWRTDFAKVSTLRGYCSATNAERARLQGQPEAWTVFAGTIVVNDIAYHNERKRKFEAAAVLQQGMTVIIEGREYRVRVVPGNTGKSPRNSDPIAFEPISANVQEVAS